MIAAKKKKVLLRLSVAVTLSQSYLSKPFNYGQAVTLLNASK